MLATCAHMIYDQWCLNVICSSLTLGGCPRSSWKQSSSVLLQTEARSLDPSSPGAAALRKTRKELDRETPRNVKFISTRDANDFEFPTPARARVCMCVCVCACVHACVHANVCACMWGHRLLCFALRTMRCAFRFLVPLELRGDFAWQGKLSGRTRYSAFLTDFPKSDEGYGVCFTVWPLVVNLQFWGSGFQTCQLLGASFMVFVSKLSPADPQAGVLTFQ